MRSSVSVRLDDALLREMKAKASDLHLSQTDYIRTAIQQMNHDVDRQNRKRRLKEVSLKVRSESIKINKEFSKIDRDPEASIR